MSPEAEKCEYHGTPKRVEPLTRFDGSPIGNLTISVCDLCDVEADYNLDTLIARVVNGELP